MGGTWYQVPSYLVPASSWYQYMVLCVCVYVLFSFAVEANFGPVLTVKF